MRILHVSNHTAMFNGMVHAMVDLACAQKALGHTVAVCTSGGTYTQFLIDQNIEIIKIKDQNGVAGILHNAIRMFGIIRRFKPDVIHCHMTLALLISYPAAKTLRVPLISCVQNSFSRFSIVMGLGDRVITGCKAVAEDMQRRGVSRRKLRPILNGTIGSPRHVTELPSPEVLQRPAILTVCGLHPRKGVGDLISAFGRCRENRSDLHLYIVGEGPSEQDFRNQVLAKQIENVHFVAPRPDPRSYLLGADLFVLASLADPAPLVLSEAREAGLAVIASDVDGIPELLEMGRAGILTPPSDSAALSEHILNVLRTPETLSNARAASQFNIGYLSLERVARETVAVYGEMIKS